MGIRAVARANWDERARLFLIVPARSSSTTSPPGCSLSQEDMFNTRPPIMSHASSALECFATSNVVKAGGSSIELHV